MVIAALVVVTRLTQGRCVKGCREYERLLLTFRTQTDSHCIICTGEGIQRKLEEPVRMEKWSLMKIG